MNLPPQRQKELDRLLQRIGLSGANKVNFALLDRALTHASISSDYNNEQLEFVGDGVVRLAIARFLWDNYNALPVGEFSALRSVLASDRILAEIAESYGFDRYLLVAQSVAREKAGYDSRLSDACEAVVGALYLSTDSLELIRPWLDSHFAAIAERTLRDPARFNYKAALQEWTQGEYKILPEYRVIENGSEYDRNDRFTARVWLRGRCLGEGTGRSIKAAEQAAAKEAFLARG